MDTLRLYVVWHPDYVHGEKYARAISDHFNSVGMVRDNVRLAVPVRVRSIGWDGSSGGHPRQVELEDAETNGIIILHESKFKNGLNGNWRQWLEDLGSRIDVSDTKTFILNTALTRRAQSGLENLAPECFKKLQNYRFFDHGGTHSNPSGPSLTRFLLHIVNHVNFHFSRLRNEERGGEGQPIPDKGKIFLSHAKRDGRPFAKAIHDYIHTNPTAVDSFLDEDGLIAGNNYEKDLEDKIASSSFLYIQTDEYGSRPFCRWELLRAKQHRRPIVSVFRFDTGEDRVFPYGGNIPFKPISISSKQNPAGDGNNWLATKQIENLLLQLMSEVLRCIIWQRMAERACQLKLKKNPYVLLPRPPELADLAFLKKSRIEEGKDAEPLIAVYPDPPLDDNERGLLDIMRGSIDFLSISEVENRP